MLYATFASGNFGGPIPMNYHTAMPDFPRRSSLLVGGGAVRAEFSGAGPHHPETSAARIAVDLTRGELRPMRFSPAGFARRHRGPAKRPAEASLPPSPRARRLPRTA
jgi:hypothetical protein